jgi:hypothetical protein
LWVGCRWEFHTLFLLVVGTPSPGQGYGESNAISEMPQEKAVMS